MSLFLRRFKSTEKGEWPKVATWRFRLQLGKLFIKEDAAALGQITNFGTSITGDFKDLARHTQLISSNFLVIKLKFSGLTLMESWVDALNVNSPQSSIDFFSLKQLQTKQPVSPCTIHVACLLKSDMLLYRFILCSHHISGSEGQYLQLAIIL